MSYSEEAPKLFDEYWASCHIVNSKGGTVEPDLSTVGSRRSINFLEAFTENPSSVLSGTTMPAYQDTLTDEQIKNLAAYLSGLRGESGSP